MKMLYLLGSSYLCYKLNEMHFSVPDTIEKVVGDIAKGEIESGFKSK